MFPCVYVVYWVRACVRVNAYISKRYTLTNLIEIYGFFQSQLIRAAFART